jgi:hypothetical protein
MSDTDEAGDTEDEEDAASGVELGTGPAVEGQPVARVASRLTWPAERSAVREQEGDATVRTPDGPTDLDAILAASDVPLFEDRSEFLAAVEDVIGRGPVATE